MTILIILFTLLLIVDCLFLGLLILVQLPKKEAGVGMAFGSGATDALFGAGSGNALTTLTKYSAGAFFVLVFTLSVLNGRASHPNSDAFKRQMEKAASPAATTPATATTTAPAKPAPAVNLLSTSTNTPAPAATAPATPPSNAPAAPAK